MNQPNFEPPRLPPSPFGAGYTAGGPAAQPTPQSYPPAPDMTPSSPYPYQQQRPPMAFPVKVVVFIAAVAFLAFMRYGIWEMFNGGLGSGAIVFFVAALGLGGFFWYRNQKR